MTDIAIRVHNPRPACPERSRREHSRRVSKRYRIGASQPRYRTLRDTLTDAFTTPFRRLSSTVAKETIWALKEPVLSIPKDVSFEVNPGEVVGTLAPRCGCSAGVIGRNGAGTRAPARQKIPDRGQCR